MYQLSSNKLNTVKARIKANLSSGVSTWKVLSMTVVHCKQRMMKVFGLGRSVFINWHSESPPRETFRDYTDPNMQRLKGGMACSCLTCYREVVERIGQVRVLRFVLVADEGAICLEQKVTWSPVLDVFACRETQREKGHLPIFLGVLYLCPMLLVIRTVF